MNKSLLPGLRYLFIIHCIVGLLFGLALLLLPATFLDFYGFPTTDLFFARSVGAAILAFTASSFLAIQANQWERVKIIVQAEIVWTVLDTLLLLWGQLTLGLNALGWLTVAMMAFFAAAFAYFYMQEERVAVRQTEPA